MTISDWLKQSLAKLETAGIATARLDSLVLLEDELGKDRAWLLAQPDYRLQRSEIRNLSTKIAQRCQHMPLAYIRGHAEFYGREFMVNTHTLVPRPETETMVDLLKTLMPGVQPPAYKNEVVMVDVGTGSGAIAITLKLEFPGTKAIATDIDKTCLEVARTNAQKLGADVEFMHGTLLQPLKDRKFGAEKLILLCNLPYIPDSFNINRAATHEPKHALFGGNDGLDVYREMFAEVAANDWKPAYIFTESLPPQHAELSKIAKATGYTLQKTDDFIQLFQEPEKLSP